MSENTFEMGLIGLGVMGRNLALNIVGKGFSLLGHDKDAGKVADLKAHAPGPALDAELDVVRFVKRLKAPRVVMFLVPAGAPVDTVIAELEPHLAPGDILIDGGNSHFADTRRRQEALSATGIHFVGMGVSGGEEGARRGPSLMPGGPRAAFERVQPILEAIAARAGGEPCVAYLGPGPAGHYVKMVHNGIEYALMQLLAESYDLLHRGLGMDEGELHQTFSEWNRSPVASFLVEITADIFLKQDSKTGKPLVEMISDAARAKGTGKWTAEESMNLQVATTAIDTAVAMRDLSKQREQRERASRLLAGPAGKLTGNREAFARRLRDAFHGAMVLTFAQGLALLREAAKTYHFEFREETIARIWRGGCIIRAALLEDVARAFRESPELSNLMLDARFAKTLAETQSSLRTVISEAAEAGLPVPAFMACLSYYDSFRSARLPMNLVQAQRDYFGAHTYERIDEPGTFHTQWD